MTSPAVEVPVESEQAFPNRNFRALWAAVGVSQMGSAVSIITVPLVAVVSLGASAAQMAWLVALGLAPALLIRVPAAAWSDSLGRSRIPIMIGCNLVQAAIIGSVPLLWWLDALSIVTLLILAALASAALGVYSSLNTPVLRQVVPKDYLVDANGKLQATRSAADITGPAVAGGLLALVSAPLVLLIDTVSFLMSATLLSRISIPAAQPKPSGARGPGMKSIAGLARSLLTRSAMQAMVSVGFVNGLVQTVLLLFLSRDLHLPPSAIGLLLGLGAVGGVGGGLLAGRVQRRLGPGRTLALGAIATTCSLALLPFSHSGWSAWAAVVLFELAGSLGGTLMVATVFGGLQSVAPEGKVAQTMALAGTFLQLAALIGAPLGGVLGTQIGLRATLTLALVLMGLLLLPQVLRWAARRWHVDDKKLA